MTELVFILDRSGSMAGLEEDTVGGFNAMLEKQKAQPGAALVTTVLFDHEAQMIHDRIPLELVQPMTREQYFVRGCTALLDALGDAIRHISDIHKYARREDRPEKTVFVITTDGMENASRRFGREQVRRMVRQMEQEHGWEFLFLGANIDAVAAAGSMGIRAERAVNYHADREGTALNYTVLSDAIGTLRRDAPLSASWKAPIDADFRKRKK